MIFNNIEKKKEKILSPMIGGFLALVNLRKRVKRIITTHDHHSKTKVKTIIM